MIRYSEEERDRVCAEEWEKGVLPGTGRVMDRDTAIKKCRYYGGEEECPEALKEFPAGEFLWFYEMKWVQFLLQGEVLDWDVQEYNAYGMADFSLEDGVPVSLKALLFNRFYKDGYVEFGGARFRRWYQEIYLQHIKK